ncbi:hypothetical protein FQN55_005889 [Onygenales sp. PD_40]|nr:hypothetical protein FQN55_005889 [Onygenales sp. PD_40]KAK2791892.1 hypothetical protein FQN52_004334 [Onygenales sp. PD_12]
MFTRLRNALAPSGPPSVFLAVSKSNFIEVLHILPENGHIERFSMTTHSPTFRHRGTKEQTRELIGEVTIYVGDGETTFGFVNDVKTRARKLWDRSQILLQPESVDVIHRLEKEVLRPAGLDTIREREGRNRSPNETQTYSVFIIRINRSRAGRILSDRMMSFG